MDTGLGAKAYAIIEQGKIGLILSSRPTDRRQLIEEAAGITKYKARRRAAELKLEAAQQNLTRIDDIVFEVEKQRGSLKRQAAKARRYTRLRDEMRRWEKVLFARRYRALGEVIESARARGWPTRASRKLRPRRGWRKWRTSSRALRIELAEAEPRRRRVREAAHARELEINRRQQQIALDGQQAEMLARAPRELEHRTPALDGRREPERIALEERRAAAAAKPSARATSRRAAAAAAGAESRAAQQAIEAAEQDVERARGDVYAVMNTVTALHAAAQSAAAQRERAAEALGRLDVGGARSAPDRARSRRRRARVGATMRCAARTRRSTPTRIARAARESELASARIEHEWRAREVRSREHELASLTARLRSLEELDAHRAGFSDAARMVLVQANGRVGQMGALADVLEVEPRYERAVEACLGELLQHVLVRRHEHAAAGLALVRQEDAGRCGFVVVEPGRTGRGVQPRGSTADVEREARTFDAPVGAVRAVGRRPRRRRVPPRAARGHWRGGHRRVVRDRARAGAARVGARSRRSKATCCAAHIVAGGGKVEARGILATKREIKELRERVATERDALERLAAETAPVRADDRPGDGGRSRPVRRAASPGEVASSRSRRSCTRAGRTSARLPQRAELVATETAARARGDCRARRAAGRSARVDRAARATSARAETRARRRAADAVAAREHGRSAGAARRRSAGDARRRWSSGAPRSPPTCAGSKTRRASSSAGVETCATDIDADARSARAAAGRRRRRQRLMDDDVRRARERCATRCVRGRRRARSRSRPPPSSRKTSIRDARRALDAVRALAAELDVTRATAEAELTHLAQQCLDAVAVPLDDGPRRSRADGGGRARSSPTCAPSAPPRRRSRRDDEEARTERRRSGDGRAGGRPDPAAA